MRGSYALLYYTHICTKLLKNPKVEALDVIKPSMPSSVNRTVGKAFKGTTHENLSGLGSSWDSEATVIEGLT